MGVNKLTIKELNVGGHYAVKINDIDVPHIRSLSINMYPGEVPTAMLELNIDELDLELSDAVIKVTEELNPVDNMLEKLVEEAVERNLGEVTIKVNNNLDKMEEAINENK